MELPLFRDAEEHRRYQCAQRHRIAAELKKRAKEHLLLRKERLVLRREVACNVLDKVRHVAGQERREAKAVKLDACGVQRGRSCVDCRVQ